jgi:phytoene synthase
MAARLLPKDKRQAVHALYAFCRTVDDLVDEAGENPESALAPWKAPELMAREPDANPVAVAWTDARARFRIPQLYAEQLIDGVARDLHQSRYDTFEELAAYAYGVASTVGLMSMNVVGFHHEAAIPYAMRMGVALQLTNILRDVGEDWRRGRVYLPREEMEGFGVCEADVEASLVSDRWRALMRFQIERACRLYAQSWPGLALLARKGRLAIAAAADFYAAILDDIVAHDYDVFGRRAHLSGWAKVRRVPGLWWRTRQFNYARWMANGSYPAWTPCRET